MSTTERPRTLLAISGSGMAPAPLDRAVVVVIDAQNEYVAGPLRLAGVEAAVAEIGRLLSVARSGGTPVVHVVQHSPPGRPVFQPGTAGAEVIAGLGPIDGEAVVIKRLPNAFAGTSLRTMLAEHAAAGRPEIVLAGFMTHMCISATARAALDLGIPNTVVAAATATRSLPDPLGGGSIPAEVVHASALAELADRFSAVVRGVDDLARARAAVA